MIPMHAGKPLRVGVIGVGHLGAIHAKLWREVEGVQLCGVVDTNQERAAEIAALHGVRAYPDAASLLVDVDAVSVVTTTVSHAATGAAVISAGRHCFVEKPITATVQEAHALCKAARDEGVVLQVGHVERFNPALLAVEGMIDEPRFIESHRLAQFSPRASDVAVVHDLMIHDIDVILSLVNSAVARVDANGVSVVTDHADIANARIQFENGCVANVTASRISAQPMRKMRIFQHDAYVSIDFAAPSVEVFRLVDPESTDAPMTNRLGQIERGSQKRAIVHAAPEIPAVNALKRELEMFRDAIRNGTPPPVTGEEATRALEVAEEIMRQICQ
jgi:predicted dehydrogenase